MKTGAKYGAHKHFIHIKDYSHKQITYFSKIIIVLYQHLIHVLRLKINHNNYVIKIKKLHEIKNALYLNIPNVVEVQERCAQSIVRPQHSIPGGFTTLKNVPGITLTIFKPLVTRGNQKYHTPLSTLNSNLKKVYQNNFVYQVFLSYFGQAGVLSGQKVALCGLVTY